MIGTGAFKLASYQSGYLVKLTANADYHQGKPLLDGIERPVKIDPFSRQTAYETGELDFTDVQRGELDRIKGETKLTVEMKQFDPANIYYMAIHHLHLPQFKEKRYQQ